MDTTHEELNITIVIPDDLRQRHIEEFFRAIREIRGENIDLSAPEYNGIVVRAGVRLDWMVDVTEEEIADMHPAGVTWAAGIINDAIAQAYVISGE